MKTKLIIIGLVMLFPIGLVSAEESKPIGTLTIKQLRNKAGEYNDLCRGGAGDNDSTWEACGKRSVYYDELNARGWCYGLETQATFEYKWHKCVKGSIGYTALDDNYKPPSTSKPNEPTPTMQVGDKPVTEEVYKPTVSDTPAMDALNAERKAQAIAEAETKRVKDEIEAKVRTELSDKATTEQSTLILFFLAIIIGLGKWLKTTKNKIEIITVENSKLLYANTSLAKQLELELKNYDQGYEAGYRSGHLAGYENGYTNAKTVNYPIDIPRNIRRFILSKIHPDKNNNSELSNTSTKWINTNTGDL